MASHLARTELQSIKAAARRLVEAVGGLEACAAACRLGRSQLARCYSPTDPDMLPADVVAELERAAGEAPMTTVLARLSGHTLLPVAGDGSGPALLRQLGDLMARAGEACRVGAEAMADGRLTDEECEQLADRLHEVTTQSSRITAWLASPEARALRAGAAEAA